jgi:2-methylcitrate dehydratase PrpD
MDFMATVTIDLADGCSLAAQEVYPRGSPRNPATPEEIDSKFRSLSEAVLTPAETERLIAAIHSLEHLGDVGQLASQLARSGRRQAPGSPAASMEDQT